MNKIKKRFLSVMFALMISLSISAVSAYAEGGTIYDFTTASAVMGVWIEVKDGDSGWAIFHNRQLVSAIGIMMLRANNGGRI